MTQCILTGDCIKTIDALDLTTESTVEIVGKVEKVKEGQTAPEGVEVIVDYWKIIGLAPGGKEAFESIIQPVSLPPFMARLTIKLTRIGHGQLATCRLATSRASRRDRHGLHAGSSFAAPCLPRSFPSASYLGSHPALYGSNVGRGRFDLVRI